MKGSGPRVFYDHAVARGHVRPAKPAPGAPTPKAPANPARIVGELLAQFELSDGWREFQEQCGMLSALASTPGWEDSDSKKTTPDAKAIGLAQWGAAIATAGILAEASQLGWPNPGIDPAGFIWLNWTRRDHVFNLQLHANLLHQGYKWRRIIDGMPREHESTRLDDVVQALKAFASEAKS